MLDQRNGSFTLSFNPAVSAHPLGGAVLGKACYFDGRVRRYPGLYVVDVTAGANSQPASRLRE